MWAIRLVNVKCQITLTHHSGAKPPPCKNVAHRIIWAHEIMHCYWLAINIYSNNSLEIVIWNHRPRGRFAPHDKVCDILREPIKSRFSADMLSLRM